MFGEIPRKKNIKICAKFDENCRKILIFAEIRTKIRKSLTNFCKHIEFGAVRRCVNLVDLENCEEISLWLQKSASIQKRTSPLKLYHFRYPKTDFTASDLSTREQHTLEGATTASLAYARFETNYCLSSLCTFWSTSLREVARRYILPLSNVFRIS